MVTPGAHRPKDVCRVAALASAALRQPAPLRHRENCVEEPALRPTREKARAELAQDRVVEADVGQLQAQRILPVDPRADRIGGLPVGQPLHELQECRECEPDRRLSGPPPGREQAGKVAILDEHVQSP